MGRNLVAARNEETPLIVPILAIISVILYSMFPQHATIAKTNNNTKTKISQNKPSDFHDSGYLRKSMIFVQQNSLLAQSRNLSNSLCEKRDKSKEEQKIVGQNENTKTVPKRKMRVLATAYSSTVDQCDSTPFITANGTRVHNGTLAANFLKFGTKVRFPSLYGDKIFTVEDRMRSNTKVDLWFPTRQEAKNFGVKIVEMEVL